jgi:hypothetical protein
MRAENRNPPHPKKEKNKTVELVRHTNSQEPAKTRSSQITVVINNFANASAQ